MSVVLYRKNESGELEKGTFPPEQVPGNLEQLNHEGWFLDPSRAEPTRPEPTRPGKTVADFMGGIDYGMRKEWTLEELREKAKEAGYENWETARTKTLKKILHLGE